MQKKKADHICQPPIFVFSNPPFSYFLTPRSRARGQLIGCRSRASYRVSYTSYICLIYVSYVSYTSHIRLIYVSYVSYVLYTSYIRLIRLIHLIYVSYTSYIRLIYVLISRLIRYEVCRVYTLFTPYSLLYAFIHHSHNVWLDQSPRRGGVSYS